MTMITVERALLEQVMFALETKGAHHPRVYAAIAALRKALEQLVVEPANGDIRDAFERYWVTTRGDKKAARELQRHPLQPQTYVQDSANRHWVTWQAAQQALDHLAHLKDEFYEETVDALREALAQPEQEPVASIYVTTGGEREFDDWHCPLPVGIDIAEVLDMDLVTLIEEKALKEAMEAYGDD